MASPHRPLFAPIPDASPHHQKAISAAREASVAMQRELADFSEATEKDKRWSSDGKAEVRDVRFLAAARDVVGAFDSARKAVRVTREDAFGKLQSRLWNGVDRAADLAKTQDRLLAIVLKDPVPSKLPTDAANGHAVLLASGRTLSFLDGVLRTAPSEAARGVALAVLRADPLLKHLLGGEPVTNAVLRGITDRVAEDDPEAAGYVEQIDQADTLLAIVNDDQRRALESTAQSLGLGKEAGSNYGRADPIAEQRIAQRKAS